MVALEGVVLVVVAAILVARAIGGAHEKAISGYGTAVWYVAVGSQQWAYGVPVALVAVGVLALLFSPSALQWASASTAQDSARADNSGPETR